jgi:hypothetical protein
LTLWAITRQCLDEIDRLRTILGEIREAFGDYGPVDDGRPEGDRFDNALTYVIGGPTPRKRATRRKKS